MSELEDSRSLMEEKVKNKRNLIKTLREASNRVMKLQEELKKAIPKDKRVRKKSPERIQDDIDKVEFSIATSAYTPIQEKNLIRKMKMLKKELKDAVDNSGEWKEVYQIKEKLRAKRKDRKKIRKELDKISKELDELYKIIIVQSSQSAKEKRNAHRRSEDSKEWGHKKSIDKKRKQEQRKEMEPYMKEIDSFVSLEDIAIIKKKKEAKE